VSVVVTDAQDIEQEKTKELEALKRYLDGYDSVEELERHRKQPLTAHQTRLFDEYYERKEEQRERHRIIGSWIVRRHHRTRIYRDRRGRFARK
jgi:hypothetical protein